MNIVVHLPRWLYIGNINISIIALVIPDLKGKSRISIFIFGILKYNFFQIKFPLNSLISANVVKVLLYIYKTSMDKRSWILELKAMNNAVKKMVRAWRSKEVDKFLCSGKSGKWYWFSQWGKHMHISYMINIRWLLLCLIMDLLIANKYTLEPQ